jgi:hypothetical protein
MPALAERRPKPREQAAPRRWRLPKYCLQSRNKAKDLEERVTKNTRKYVSLTAFVWFCC